MRSCASSEGLFHDSRHLACTKFAGQIESYSLQHCHQRVPLPKVQQTVLVQSECQNFGPVVRGELWTSPSEKFFAGSHWSLAKLQATWTYSLQSPAVGSAGLSLYVNRQRTSHHCASIVARPLTPATSFCSVKLLEAFFSSRCFCARRARPRAWTLLILLLAESE